MRDVSFAEVAEAIRKAHLPACDLVVGIGTGGTVPASLIAYKLGVPLYMEWYNFRGADNQPLYDAPKRLGHSPIPDGARHALLVDDVAVTGRTLKMAAANLENTEVTTLVLKGTADIVLMPHLDTCVRWPWHHYCKTVHTTA